MNHHWRTFKGQCAPCGVKYDYITHLEFSKMESDFLLEKMKVSQDTYIPGKYSWSPAGRDEEKWSSIPRGTAKRIYKHFYVDFILFGYSPDVVKRFIEAANAGLHESTLQERQKSVKNLRHLRKEFYDNGNEDFVCRPDT